MAHFVLLRSSFRAVTQYPCYKPVPQFASRKTNHNQLFSFGGRLMRQVTMLAALLLALFSTPASLAETPGKQSFKIAKNPTAMIIAENAVNAMGGTAAIKSYQDSLATGTLTLYQGDKPTTFPITLKSKGTHETRIELQTPDGIQVRILNQGRGAIQRPDGTVKTPGLNNLVGERVGHIPLLSLLSEYQNPDISLVYQGTALVNGQSTKVIAVSFVPYTDLMQGPFFSSITKTFFYVDQVTGLIDKIQYSNYEEGNWQQSRQTIEDYFTEYKTVSGVSVPFHQTTYADGKLDADLVLTSVTFSVGLSDSEFKLPQ
jgi:hypothetical protein